MGEVRTENEKYAVTCDRVGNIIIWDKEAAREEVIPTLFGEGYHYRYYEWNVTAQIYITPDSRYIIVTYGMGHIYLIDSCTRKVIKRIILFDEICYEDTSYQSIDTYYYCNETTRVDFSSTGRYAAIRVRGDVDPSSETARRATPLYFRSVFLLDLTTLDICFQETFEDVEDHSSRNIAAIAFSPQDHYFAVGALGNQIKIFSLGNNKCVGKYSSLEWIADPLRVKHCRVICFLAEDAFIYVDREYNIRRITQRGQDWLESGILYTNLPPDIKPHIEDIEVDRKKGTVRCQLVDNCERFREEKVYRLEFADGEKIQ